jgi:hypothetical protein
MTAESNHRNFPATNGSNTANNAAVDCSQLLWLVAGGWWLGSQRRFRSAAPRRFNRCGSEDSATGTHEHIVFIVRSLATHIRSAVKHSGSPAFSF